MGDRRGRFALGGFALWVLLLLSVGGAQAATLFVTNTSDSGVTGDGSLRGEILAASSGDVINFDVSGTITLGSTLPTIGINLTIDGSGQSVTVDGANSFEIFNVNSVGTLNLKFLTLAHGRATSVIQGENGEGGAIFNNGTLTAINCTFSGNQAIGASGAPGGEGDGGAIFNQGTLNVANSTFSGNHAVGGAGGGRGDGGAIINLATLDVTNSTFSGNQAVGGADSGPGNGGAIFSFVTLHVTNSTFSSNQAVGGAGGGQGHGGAINNTSGTVSLHGTILAGSSGGNCAGTTTDAGYNISDDNSCGFTIPPSGTSVNNSTTLHLDALANNGGPTNTIALEFNSEAVDFIPVANCTDQSSPTPQPLTTDQRGLPRPDFGNPRFCDAGAFELQTTPIVIEANGERLQIVHAINPSGDQLNTAFTFIENESPTCDAADDPFNGLIVTVSTGTCANLGSNAFSLFLDPFTVHTVNHQTYGTLFSADPPITLSVRMVELPTPAPPACGEWTMNLEFAGIDLTSLGNGPFALILTELDGEQGCLDITNAIVGNQIPPPVHGVRRRVRRR